MKIDYTNLSFTQLIDKIETNRFFDLPRMVREAFRRLLSRVEALEDAPAPTGNFIPLTGTEVGSPVTGDIEMQEYTKLWWKNGDYLLSLENVDEYLYLQIYNPITGYFSKFIIDGDTNNFRIETNNPNSVGLVSVEDFSERDPNNKLIYTQRSYVDARGSVFNATTSVLSASDLNTAYPNAKDGFSVIAPNVVGGGKYYIKAGAGWVYQQVLAVV